MVKKLVVLAVFSVVLCFAGAGCFWGPYVGDDGPYYDGPYVIDGGSYYYYNGGFYDHHGGAFRFHHEAPQDRRGYYDEEHRRNRELYNHDYPKWREQHSGHPWASRR